MCMANESTGVGARLEWLSKARAEKIGLPWPLTLVITGIVGRQMMKLYPGVLSIVLTGLLAIGLSACEKEGPAESAGKAIDEAASQVADEAKEAKEAVEKKME